MRRLTLRSAIVAAILAAELSLLAAPALAQAPAAPAPATPSIEDQFIKAVDDARQTFSNGLNDMVRGVARPRRAEALCRLIPRGRMENWLGKLATLGSSPGGRGVVGIELTSKLLVSTNRTEAADEKDKTLIDVRSPLFGNAAVLAVGDRVLFSGTLFSGTDDCFKEVGKDVATSMATPEFIMRLDAIKKVIPPTATAVLGGQATAMTIAQSSDYVRDAVDIIAGGTACGAESRRVFAIVIKVLIRATVGQSPEQRDALIGLMFSPPSAQSQAKENCDGKAAALDRLEAEVS